MACLSYHCKVLCYLLYMLLKALFVRPCGFGIFCYQNKVYEFPRDPDPNIPDQELWQ